MDGSLDCGAAEGGGWAGGPVQRSRGMHAGSLPSMPPAPARQRMQRRAGPCEPRPASAPASAPPAAAGRRPPARAAPRPPRRPPVRTASARTLFVGLARCGLQPRLQWSRSQPAGQQNQRYRDALPSQSSPPGTPPASGFPAPCRGRAPRWPAGTSQGRGQGRKQALALRSGAATDAQLHTAGWSPRCKRAAGGRRSASASCPRSRVPPLLPHTCMSLYSPSRSSGWQSSSGGSQPPTSWLSWSTTAGGAGQSRAASSWANARCWVLWRQLCKPAGKRAGTGARICNPLRQDSPPARTLMDGLQRGAAPLQQPLPRQVHPHLPARHLQQRLRQLRQRPAAPAEQVLRAQAEVGGQAAAEVLLQMPGRGAARWETARACLAQQPGQSSRQWQQQRQPAPVV